MHTEQPAVGAPVEPSVRQHTPGPWSVFEWSGHRALSSDDSASGFGIEAAGYRLPLSDVEGDIDEAAANARLMAAAPDLLAELERILPGAEAMGWDTTKARAAIAKALGTAA